MKHTPIVIGRTVSNHGALIRERIHALEYIIFNLRRTTLTVMVKWKQRRASWMEWQMVKEKRQETLKLITVSLVHPTRKRTNPSARDVHRKAMNTRLHLLDPLAKYPISSITLSFAETLKIGATCALIVVIAPLFVLSTRMAPALVQRRVVAIICALHRSFLIGTERNRTSTGHLT